MTAPEMVAACSWQYCKREGTNVSSAESRFQRREGGKWDDFRHCRSTVSYSFRRAYIHVAEYLIRVLIRLVCFQGDRRVGMLSEWELSRMRVRVRRPTSVRCNIVEYVLTGGWRMVLSGKRETREKTKEENVRKGNLQASTHVTPEAHSERSGWAHPTLHLRSQGDLRSRILSQRSVKTEPPSNPCPQ